MVSIENILCEVYGVGLCFADPVTVLWAAEKIEDIEVAKKELKKANRIREKHGKCLVYVPFGHRLF